MFKNRFRNSKKISILLLTGIIALSPFLAQAVDSALPDVPPKDILKNILNVAAGYGATIAALMIIIAAFVWMTAGGDDERITIARKMLIGAVVGLVIIGIAYGVINVAVGLFAT